MADDVDEYLASTCGDIAQLPASLARTAKVIDHGEAEWPPELAEQAIRALIALGRVVNVLLQVRKLGDGWMTYPLGTYEGSDPEANLRYVLAGIDKLDPDIPASVCWYPADL